MEHQNSSEQWLNILERPAFGVRDGVVVLANDAASRRQIEVGTPISAYLHSDNEAYRSFTDGSLSVSLSVNHTCWEATVVKISGMDVFLMKQEKDYERLKSMALMAMKLREPLSGIMSVKEILYSQEYLAENPHARKNLARLNRNLLAIQRHLGNIADISRYHNTVNCIKTNKNLTAFLNEIMDKAAGLIEGAGYTLIYTGPNEDIITPISTERLERAVYNLLSNAVKFSSAGSTIRASLCKKGKMAIFSVEDQGKGIPQEKISNVFSHYLREPDVEDGNQGIGLGMYFVQDAAKVHNGTVLIQQAEDSGLRITMTISLENTAPGDLRSEIFTIDYSGGQDHGLLELSDALPTSVFE